MSTDMHCPYQRKSVANKEWSQIRHRWARSELILACFYRSEIRSDFGIYPRGSWPRLRRGGSVDWLYRLGLRDEVSWL
jgi:hypothetical protein